MGDTLNLIPLCMPGIPVFPTKIHEDTAQSVWDYFAQIPEVDTVLVVNSCARGQAVPESDLDFAILMKPDVRPSEIKMAEAAWHKHVGSHPAFARYKQSGPHALLHLDLIDGNYNPGIMEEGGGPDYFEIEIGNQVCYSAPLGEAGDYFRELQMKWMPYYDEELRLQRLAMTRESCEYELNHIPAYLERGLYFHSFDRLYVAFQKFLQAVFIAGKTYPIAYNKWIRLQVETWLNRPDLYRKLPSLLSVGNIESWEIQEKAIMIRELLDDITH